MKKLFILAMGFIALTTSAFAGTGNNTISTVLSKGTVYEMIVVNDDIDVVLTESSVMDIVVTGEEESITLVKHRVKRGVLEIGSKMGSLKGKATVYISVAGLKKLEVNGKSHVSTRGTLNSKTLIVIVNGEAKFDLKNAGEIIFEADEDIDLNFENWSGENPLVPAPIENTSLKNADAAMDALMIQFKA
jgi:hypothetical protein